MVEDNRPRCGEDCPFSDQHDFYMSCALLVSSVGKGNVCSATNRHLIITRVAKFLKENQDA